MTVESERKERDSRIELLRVISMIMIMMMHCMASSGALYDQSGWTALFYWWVEALCISSVDVFVLISGYFLVSTKFHSKSIMRLLGTVWSYAFLASLICALACGEKLSAGSLIRMMCPILTKKYWFVNAYLGMLILSPFMNRLIHTIRRKQMNYLVVFLLIMLVIRPTVLPKSWAQDLSAGLSVFFFVGLYFLAAWLRLYGEKIRQCSSWYYLLTYFAISVFLPLIRSLMICVGINSETATHFYNYTSAFVVLQAVSLFCLFLNIKPIRGSASALINTLAKYSFAAYIIHYPLNPILWNWFRVGLSLTNIPLGSLRILGSVLTAYICCAAIEAMRQKVLMALPANPYVERVQVKWDELVNADL